MMENWNGFPPNRNEDAFHWLWHKSGANEVPCFWDADRNEWVLWGQDSFTNPEDVKEKFSYSSRALTCDDVMDLLDQIMPAMRA